MASWAAVLALSGFHYSGVAQSIEFGGAERPGQVFWSNGYAWGLCVQTPTAGDMTVDLTVLHGTLTLRRLSIAGAGAIAFASPRRIGPGEQITVRVERHE